MKITEYRTKEILNWLDDKAADHALLFEQMALHRDAAALIRQLHAAEQSAWHAGIDAGREQGRGKDHSHQPQSALEAKPSSYDRKRIAWELERTAMGDGHYGSALRAAKDFPEATPCVRLLLDRWATGRQLGLTDRTDLCAFALQIYSADEDSPSAPVVGRALEYLRPYLEAGTFSAPDWAIQLASILTGGDGCGKPVPPSTPVGAEGLPRYGFPDGNEPRPVPCTDGYWTPWHLAQALRNEAHATAAKDAEIEELRADLADYMRIANTEATRAERLAEALRDARDYVTTALREEREKFAGHEDCSDIPGIEADLHKIDSALNPTAAQEKDDA